MKFIRNIYFLSFVLTFALLLPKSSISQIQANEIKQEDTIIVYYYTYEHLSAGINFDKNHIFLQIKVPFNARNHSPLVNIRTMRNDSYNRALFIGKRKFTAFVNEIIEKQQVLFAMPEKDILESLYKIRKKRIEYDSISFELQLDLYGKDGLYNLLESDAPIAMPTIPQETFYEPISSIIIDLRKFKTFQMSLLPMIFSNTGLLLYTPFFASTDCLIQSGGVKYHKTLESAYKDKIGAHPKYIHAIGISDDKKGAVLTKETTKKILSNPSGTKSMQECKVFFIVP